MVTENSQADFNELPLAVDFTQKEAPQLLPNPPILSSHQSKWQNIHLAHHRQPEMYLPELYNPQHIVIIPLGHNTVEIEFLSEGRLHDVLYEGKDYQGCIQVFPANLPYKLTCKQQSNHVEFIHCYLEPSFLAQVAYEAVNPDRVELLLELKKIDQLIYQIGFALKADLEKDGVGDNFYADSIATALAAHLIRNYATRKHVLQEYEDGLSKRKLKQALEYINDHLIENVSLAAIADELGMSQYYFCRLFKQSTGITPYQYLIQQRIERSQQLLKQSEQTITEIALKCGFANQSHFAKCFGKHMGISPKQFRKLYQE